MTTWLVTGASGFVGGFVCRALLEQGIAVRAPVRAPGVSVPGGVVSVLSGDLTRFEDWQYLLDGVDVVVNLAGQAHDRGPRRSRAARLEAINARFPATLARRAAEAGVRRIVHLSSIKAMTGAERAKRLQEADEPHPDDDYGRSKLAGEQQLRQAALGSGIEWCIIRPTVIYGENPPGYIGLMLRAMARGLPMPLGAIRNQRSLLDARALADLIHLTGTHPDAANHLFLAADAEPLPTPDMVRALASGLGRPARCWPLPTGLLRAGLMLSGRGGWWPRLAGDLSVDVSRARGLGWSPSRDSRVGLERVARAWGQASD